MNPRSVPVPLRMRKLPLEARGYPIPKFAFIDSEGKPQFTINDEMKRQVHIRKDRCPICGETLLRFRWFVGGPASGLHPQGVYIDPPMHEECAHYALQACPYLAAPSYAGRIDGKLLPEQDAKLALFLNDPTMLDYRPDFFVAAVSRGTIWQGEGMVKYVAPVRPLVKVEFWRKGRQVDVTAGEVQAALDKALAGQPEAVAG